MDASASAPIDLPALPAALIAHDRPVTLPGGPMSGADVQRFWARDRAALIKAGASIDAIAAYYEGLQQKLGAVAR